MKQTEKDGLSALELGRIAYKEKLESGELKRLNPIEKAKQNPKSMRYAINANCYDCSGQENWIARTKYCHIFECPFWGIRKGNKAASKEDCLSWNGG